MDELACRSASSSGWKVSCQIDQDGGQRSMSSFWLNSPGRRIEIDGKSVRQAELSHCLNILWLTPTMDRLWSESAEGRRRFLDRMAMSLIPDHASYATIYERAMRERNRLLRTNGSDADWFKVLESQMVDAGIKLTRHRLYVIDRLTRAFANIDPAFPVADIGLNSPDGACATSIDSEELSESLRLGRAQDFKAGRTLTGPHRADLRVHFKTRDTPAKLCSTGEQKALLVSLVLANAQAISEDFDCPPIMLLDEIGAHLDVHRFQMLLGEAVRLNCQIWMTGTESAIFDGITNDVQKFQLAAHPGGSIVETLS